MNRKVVVTGLNIISSLGLNWEENWQNLITGQSGARQITLFDAGDMSTKIACEVPTTFNEYSSGKIKKRQAKQMTRITRVGYVCAKEAIESSGVEISSLNRERSAIITGILNTANNSIEEGTVQSNYIIKGMNNALSAWLSMEYGFEGPSYSVATACASSAFAIAQAYDLIKYGKADFVVAGGADSIINPEEISGFNALYALSERNAEPQKASCPFSADRDGFVIGEGAGFIVLESEEHAQKRNAKVLAELSGYSITSEAFNIMAPRPEGAGMAKTMKKALDDAGIPVENVDYINAHGTSTNLNDLYETEAIKNIFGEIAYKIPVSSIKSMLGHTIGAAGAIEAAVTILAIQNGIIPPTINLHNPDPDLDLDYVPNKARKHKIDVAISNSFAFGGHNASLVFEKYSSS